MTLILGMSKPDGIYMSVDYRVTDARSGRVLDDASIKFLTIHYPPDKGGPKALLAYTGLAAVPDGTPTGTWIARRSGARLRSSTSQCGTFSTG